MATITRVQHCQYDTVSMLAVQGAGTDKFYSSNQPKSCKAGFGVVLSGDLRVTKSSRSNGYFFLITGKGGVDRKRTFFRGGALVRVGDEVMTVDAYYVMLETMERVDDMLRALGL